MCVQSVTQFSIRSALLSYWKQHASSSNDILLWLHVKKQNVKDRTTLVACMQIYSLSVLPFTIHSSNIRSAAVVECSGVVDGCGTSDAKSCSSALSATNSLMGGCRKYVPSTRRSKLLVVVGFGFGGKCDCGSSGSGSSSSCCRTQQKKKEKKGEQQKEKRTQSVHTLIAN